MSAHKAAAHEARAQLIRSGHGASLAAAAATPDQIHGAPSSAQHAHLVEIASYINSDDPTEIAAAFLLELSGHNRAQLQLELQ